MILQPISSILPNFMNKGVPALQEQDQQEWWNILCQLQDLLREATGYLYKVNANKIIYQIKWNKHNAAAFGHLITRFES